MLQKFKISTEVDYARGKNMENQKLYISMYHYTRDLLHSRYPGIKGLDVDIFKRQLDFMMANFNIVTMEQVLDYYAGGKLPENPLLLTFDDGYIDNYTVALPILKERHLQGSFFIIGKTINEHQLLDVNKLHYILACADIMKLMADVKEQMDRHRGTEFVFPSTDELYEKYAVANRFDNKETIFVKRMLQTALPERLRNIISSNLFSKYVGITEEQLAYELYLNKDQIKLMQDNGMFIGVHSYDHYWLGNTDKEKVRQDLTKALEVMDEFIDKSAWVMNYPYGSYNDDVLEIVREKGAVLGLSTEVRVADLTKDNKLLLPRFDCNDFPPKSEKFKEEF